jgi:CheY-like chemotaxis protein
LYLILDDETETNGSLTPTPSLDPTAGFRVLLVDDHEDTLKIIARLLKNRGFTVTTATTVQAGLAAAEQQPFDLVISDIGLPDGDGYQLMQELHDRYQVSGIAVSGYGSAQDICRSNEVGFLAHLTKPVSIAALEHAIACVRAQPA